HRRVPVRPVPAPPLHGAERSVPRPPDPARDRRRPARGRRPRAAAQLREPPRARHPGRRRRRPGPACPGARAWPDRPSGRDEASGPDDGRESRVGAALTAGAVMTRTQTLHVAATTYTARTLAVRGIPGDDVAAWSALAHRAAEPNVFFEPEFLLPTVSSFDPDGGVRLLVVERAGEWVAVMPYEMVPGDRQDRKSVV